MIRRLVGGTVFGIGIAAGLSLFQALLPSRALAVTHRAFEYELFTCGYNCSSVLNVEAAKGFHIVSIYKDQLFLEREQ